MKILVIGPAWVGDMVMAQSLFMRLHEQYEELELDVLAPAWTWPLLERMPEVRQALDSPLGHGQLGLGLRQQMGKALAAEGYQQAIVLPNSLKSALIPWFAGIRKRTGWRGEFRYGLLNDIRKLDKARYPLMVQRFVALAHPPGTAADGQYPLPQLEAHAGAVEQLQQQFQLNLDKPVAALCPGAEFGPSKQWPPEYYAQLIQALAGRGMQLWLLGSGNDREAAERILAGLPPATRDVARDFTGQTSLGDAIDLLSMASLVISNDSGLMHVAAALQRPLVVLYGSTSPGFTPPLGQQVKTVALELECSPCFKRDCPLQHHRCMRDLKPELVLQAVDAL